MNGRLLLLGTVTCHVLLLTPAPGQVGPTTAVSSQPSAPAVMIESRGVWLDKAQILEGKEQVLARLDRLQDAGFNTVYVAMQIRGGVMYPDSAILPQYAEAAGKDPHVLDWLIPAIRQRGMHVEAWTEFGFYTYWTRDATTDASRGSILDRWPELAAVDHEGNAVLHNPEWGDFYSLCPSNPQAQDVLIRLYVEMLGRYELDGLNLDRIRYPDARFCYCQYCKDRFRKDTGLELARFGKGSREEAAFVRWRKEQLSGFMAGLSEQVRGRYSGVRITSAVVPPGMIDEKGQDWPAWLRRGYLDAAMTMLYDPDIEESLRWIRERVGREAMVFPGLNAGRGASALIGQIAQVRSMLFPGLTVWYSGTVDPLLPEVRREAFVTPARSPLYGPSAVRRAGATQPASGTPTSAATSDEP